jgi:anaerobic selenocysteine-containing dehydrogenase
LANIDRREFFKLIGAGSVGVGAGIMLGESIKHPVEYLIPEVIPPEQFSAGIATWYNTVCTMCPAGCGISVRTREGRAKKIEGNPAHPVNQGRLCARGQAGLQQLYNPDRLTTPLLRTGDRGIGSFTPTTWEEGLASVGDRLRGLRISNEGKRVCLLTKGVRGHLAQLFELFMSQLGSERLLHYDFSHPHTLYAANERFFGEQTLPYYDLKNTRYLLSFGADYLGTWLSPVHNSLGFGHSRQSHENRGHFVQIEPRMSLSGAAADEWIAARPGTEGILALGMAQHIVTAGYYDGADRDDWAAALTRYSMEQVADQTGVPAATITDLAENFARTQPGLAIGGDAVGNHSNGLNTLIAINALNYLAGNLGKPGGLIFNTAPGFTEASAPPGHARQASYRSLYEFAEQARQGNVEVLIVNDTNPLFTLPAAAGFQEALAEIPLIVSLSSFMDDTTAQADIVLPSHTYLESWGDDSPEPGVGFPVGALAQPVVSPLYDTRATGDIVLDLAQRIGLDETLPWHSMEEYLQQGWREIYQRTPAGQGTPAEGFESFWRSVLKAGVWGEKTHREHRPFTLARSVIDNIDVPAAEFSGASETYPFLLHPYLSTTLYDGRGANLPWMQELPDPMTSVVYGSWAEINPVTARQLGLSEGDLVEVQSNQGSIIVPIYIYPAIMPDVIAMPIGQGHGEYGRYAKNRGANPLQILAPQLEPHTGSLAWGATRVKVVATGRKRELVKTGGTSRDLGREIIQTTRTRTEGHTSARPALIPTRELPS